MRIPAVFLLISTMALGAQKMPPPPRISAQIAAGPLESAISTPSIPTPPESYHRQATLEAKLPKTCTPGSLIYKPETESTSNFGEPRGHYYAIFEVRVIPIYVDGPRVNWRRWGGHPIPNTYSSPLPLGLARYTSTAKAKLALNSIHLISTNIPTYAWDHISEFEASLQGWEWKPAMCGKKPVAFVTHAEFTFDFDEHR